jgi:hypothetical protein
VTDTLHQRQQREARERKRLRQAQSPAERRIVREVQIDKGLLLKLLDEAQLIPEGATRIVGTGHRPDILTVTVGFD